MVLVAVVNDLYNIPAKVDGLVRIWSNEPVRSEQNLILQRLRNTKSPKVSLLLGFFFCLPCPALPALLANIVYIGRA